MLFPRIFIAFVISPVFEERIIHCMSQFCFDSKLSDKLEDLTVSENLNSQVYASEYILLVDANANENQISTLLGFWDWAINGSQKLSLFRQRFV